MLIDDNFEELGFGHHLVFDVGAIDDKNDGIGTGVVGLPDASHSFLAAQVPRRKFNIVMGDLLDIAADGWRGLNDLPQ